MLRLSNIRVGIKLAIMSGIAILLVVGMTVIQHLNGASIVGQNFEQDQAQSVRSKVKDIQAAILRTWIARRDGLLSETAAGIDKAISALHSNTTFAQERIDNVSKSLAVPEDVERLKQARSVLGEYVASAEAQVNAHKDLLALRKRQIDTTPTWNTAYRALLAFPPARTH